MMNEIQVTFMNGTTKVFEYGRLDRTNVSYLLTDRKGDTKYELPFVSVQELYYIPNSPNPNALPSAIL